MLGGSIGPRVQPGGSAHLALTRGRPDTPIGVISTRRGPREARRVGEAVKPPKCIRVEQPDVEAHTEEVVPQTGFQGPKPSTMRLPPLDKDTELHLRRLRGRLF